MIDLDTLAQRLRDLPGLALRAAPEPARRSASAGVRTAPDSRTPVGTDLAGIDNRRGRSCFHLLVRLSDCWRVVAEAMREADQAIPAAATGYDISWASETSWLLDTMDWWSTDSWCLEWVTTEVDAIRTKLQARVDARRDPADCPVCGRRADVYTSDALMIAECDNCQRVLGMRPRRLLTTRQAAERHGVLPSSIRKLKLRGHIHEIAVIEGSSAYDTQEVDAHFNKTSAS